MFKIGNSNSNNGANASSSKSHSNCSSKKQKKSSSSETKNSKKSANQSGSNKNASSTSTTQNKNSSSKTKTPQKTLKLDGDNDDDCCGDDEGEDDDDDEDSDDYESYDEDEDDGETIDSRDSNRNRTDDSEDDEYDSDEWSTAGEESGEQSEGQGEDGEKEKEKEGKKGEIKKSSNKSNDNNKEHKQKSSNGNNDNNNKEHKKHRITPTSVPPKKHKKKVVVEQTSDDDETNDDDDSNSDSDNSDDTNTDDNEDDKGKNLKNKIRILFFGGGGGGEDGDDDSDDDDEDYEEPEKKEKAYTSDDEQIFMKENYKTLSIPPAIKTKIEKQQAETEAKKQAEAERQEKQERREKKKNRNNNKNKKHTTTTATVPTVPTTTTENDPVAVAVPPNIETEYKELSELKSFYLKSLEKNPNNKHILRGLGDCQTAIKELVKNARDDNTVQYKKITKGKQNKHNEFDYFKTKLSHKQQLQVIQDLDEINKIVQIDKPYRLAILQSRMPQAFKAIALQKLNMLKTMEAGDSEYSKLKNWVDVFMQIPFGIYKDLSVTMNDGKDKCHEFIVNSKQILDKCVYGMNDAKLQILQMLGQWITNPSAMGTAIAIKGNPGTGKTTLVKDGISKILGRDFAFIALGGAGDASYLEGHGFTYEGSCPGKIVQILKDCKSMNPVIYFDELDKISDTARGEEIVNILTHLTDTSQNNQFHDKYFSEIDFDLSKCLFIFSYNDESKVNPILKDRMYRIQTKGYETKEKIVIVKNYMLPKIQEQIGFLPNEVVIPDDVLSYLITTPSFTSNEQGVRNLKRCLEIIHTKLNLFRLVHDGTALFGDELKLMNNVSFPYTVSKKDVDILIKKEETTMPYLLMYT